MDKPNAAAENSPITEVAAGLVCRDGELLISQRRAKDHLGGFWEFPGGKREDGEEWQDAVKRELREELGIEVEPGELFWEVTHAYPEKTVHLRFYLCRWLSGKPAALGCADFRWVTTDELEQFSFPPPDISLLEQIKSELDPWNP